MKPWHQPVWRAWTERLAEGTLPHAILLSGQPGLGKGELARCFAQAVLCSQRAEDGTACGQCHACNWYQAGTHPDFHAVMPEEDSTQVKIDQIRGLIEKIALTSSAGGLQVFLVEPADAMNLSSANAFLKTLEEPTPGTLILLIASRPHDLPATVRSRCQQYQLHTPGRKQGLDWLAAEGCDPAQAARALDAAAGAPLMARAWIESGEVDRVSETLRDLNELASGRGDPLKLAAGWCQDQGAASRLEWWIGWVRVTLWERGGRAAEDKPSLTVQSDFASLIKYLDRLLKARRMLGTTVNRELLLEELLIGWRDLATTGG